jgi:hypothetical protein
MITYKNTYIKNALVSENVFRMRSAEKAEIPVFSEIRTELPQPHWENHEKAIDCYWKVWELAFRNIRKPTPENGFISNYIDTAYNDNIFMWDSAFICLFARYGTRVFNFQKTFDNFYAKQHPDGFICREIRGSDGSDCFHRYDPVSTGPNVIPWSEWEYFQNIGDMERLDHIFPVLSAYYQWLKLNRTWPDGSYWSSGWGTGMDNQPRVESKYSMIYSHGHMVWLDACLQQIFAAKILLKMGLVLERWQEIEEIEEEITLLTKFVNDNLWDNNSQFYFDRHAIGKLSGVKSIGAYWALIAGIVPDSRLDAFIKHLDDDTEFNRPHRIPSLAFSHPGYKKNGRYWQGGVWNPTNYMVLRGLDLTGKNNLAHEIALNHLNNVIDVFEKTGTVWEYYAPESADPGFMARPDFVGWGGIPPVAVLLEFILGIKADIPEKTLYWNINLTDDHGVDKYPFGKEGLVSLNCQKRNSMQDIPLFEAKSTVPVKLVVTWNNEIRKFNLEPNKTIKNH